MLRKEGKIETCEIIAILGCPITDNLKLVYSLREVGILGCPMEDNRVKLAKYFVAKHYLNLLGGALMLCFTTSCCPLVDHRLICQINILGHPPRVKKVDNLVTFTVARDNYSYCPILFYLDIYHQLLDTSDYEVKLLTHTGVSRTEMEWKPSRNMQNPYSPLEYAPSRTRNISKYAYCLHFHRYRCDLSDVNKNNFASSRVKDEVRELKEKALGRARNIMDGTRNKIKDPAGSHNLATLPEVLERIKHYHGSNNRLSLCHSILFYCTGIARSGIPALYFLLNSRGSKVAKPTNWE